MTTTFAAGTAGPWCAHGRSEMQGDSGNAGFDAEAFRVAAACHTLSERLSSRLAGFEAQLDAALDEVAALEVLRLLAL
eukprot:SAG25_NODE_5622_length_637_cov_1.624535_1_plen_78_part_00